MRTIDADELTREICRDQCERDGCGSHCELINYVENAPTIGRWISVKDRLPEEGVQVLAVKKLKDGRRDLALASCIPEYKHHDYTTGEDIVEPYWVCGGNNNITHWQPLPELPEVEG